MLLPVTSVLAIVLTALFLRYSLLIIRRRRRTHVAVFDGGDVVLGRLIRAQGNLAEYGLLLVMLVGLSEAAGVSALWLMGIALLFFAGRVCHGYGLVIAEPDEARGAQRFRWRVIGMVLTISPLALAMITLAVTLLRAML